MAGRIATITDAVRAAAVDGAVLARFAEELAATPTSTARAAPVVGESARNRFSGLVTRVVRDTVMAQVEIQAGPHRFVSLMSREAADELGLEPGMLAVAAVKATNVVVEIPASADPATETCRSRSSHAPFSPLPPPDVIAVAAARLLERRSSGSSSSACQRSPSAVEPARSRCSPRRR